MQTVNDSGLSVGGLLHGGPGLTTREVVALLVEICRNPGAAFPRTPDDLWIAETGELRISPSAHSDSPTDPRTAVADLLEAMLPAEDRDQGRTVPPPLRGLPARLRGAASSGEAPQARQDLTSVLSWHLGGDARDIIRQLWQRATHREAATSAPAAVTAAGTAPVALDGPPPFRPAAANVALGAEAVGPVRRSHADYDLDLHAHDARAPLAAPPQLETQSPPRAARPPLRHIMLAFAAGALFVVVGWAAYWLVRDQPPDPPQTTERRDAPNFGAAEPVGAPAGTATDGPSSPAETVTPVPEAKSARALPLAAAGGVFSPAFAANGQELLFHSGHSNAGRLMVASLDNRGQVSQVRTLLDERARNYHPRVSPDGRRLAFDSDRDGERGVYVADRDGSNPQRVSGSGYGAVPSWSPNMKWLAFVRGEAGQAQVWNLWLRDLSSGDLQRRTSFRSGQVWGASWFPDGRSLCYSHDTQLVISHLDARRDIVIDTPRPGRLVRTPAVSPDGRRVVFQVFKDGVWLLDVETRQVRRLLDDPTAEEFSWAPGGDRIAYHSRRDGAWRIWMMTVTG